jgi:P27 family predicted phage terminase small subunit
MGTRGPLPDPQRRKRIGTARNSALPVEVIPPSDPPLPVRPPAGLGEAGKAVWASLRCLEWVQPSDRAGVVRLCELEDERATLRAALDEYGPVLSKPVTTARGDLVGTELYANPAIRELRRLDAQILELLKAFGLTPMSRARLGLAVIAAKKDGVLTQLIMAQYREAAAAAIEVAADD